MMILGIILGVVLVIGGIHSFITFLLDTRPCSPTTKYRVVTKSATYHTPMLKTKTYFKSGNVLDGYIIHPRDGGINYMCRRCGTKYPNSSRCDIVRIYRNGDLKAQFDVLEEVVAINKLAGIYIDSDSIERIEVTQERIDEITVQEEVLEEIT